MGVISITRLYDKLTGKLGKETSEDLTNFIDNKINQSMESLKNIFATKEDIAKLETKLDGKIKETKSEMIKWMFAFWVGQMIGIIGILYLFFKK